MKLNKEELFLVEEALDMAIEWQIEQGYGDDWIAEAKMLLAKLNSTPNTKLITRLVESKIDFNKFIELSYAEKARYLSGSDRKTQAEFILEELGEEETLEFLESNE